MKAHIISVLFLSITTQARAQDVSGEPGLIIPTYEFAPILSKEDPIECYLMTKEEKRVNARWTPNARIKIRLAYSWVLIYTERRIADTREDYNKYLASVKKHGVRNPETAQCFKEELTILGDIRSRLLRDLREVHLTRLSVNDKRIAYVDRCADSGCPTPSPINALYDITDAVWRGYGISESEHCN